MEIPDTYRLVYIMEIPLFYEITKTKSIEFYQFKILLNSLNSINLSDDVCWIR